MVDILEQHEQFKAGLKNKWLDYYQANRGWPQDLAQKNNNWFNVTKQENNLEKSDYKPRRPEARFILGVISVLEPKVQGFMPYIVPLNTDPTSIVQALGLDFDPELELQQRSQQTTDRTTETDLTYLDRVREEIKI